MNMKTGRPDGLPVFRAILFERQIRYCDTSIQLLAEVELLNMMPAAFWLVAGSRPESKS